MSVMALWCSSVALAGLALILASFESNARWRRLVAFEARLGALEARQSRLQRVVERGWTQSLDLTRFDWSRQSELLAESERDPDSLSGFPPKRK